MHDRLLTCSSVHRDATGSADGGFFLVRPLDVPVEAGRPIYDSSLNLQGSHSLLVAGPCLVHTHRRRVLHDMGFVGGRATREIRRDEEAPVPEARIELDAQTQGYDHGG